MAPSTCVNKLFGIPQAIRAVRPAPGVEKFFGLDLLLMAGVSKIHLRKFRTVSSVPDNVSILMKTQPEKTLPPKSKRLSTEASVAFASEGLNASTTGILEKRKPPFSPRNQD
jgi:hypothetical protein